MLNRLLTRLRPRKDIYETIGRHQIRLPRHSEKLNIKQAFRLYDTALGLVASLTKSKYPGLCAIDIGANVGDTAALIRRDSDIPVLCVEGDAQLLPLLRENLDNLGPESEIEPTFVGRRGVYIDSSLIDDPGRNASLIGAVRPWATTALRTLDEILSDHPRFSASKLLKTDTEGFDFEIIHESLGFIKRAKPVLFFEYDPHFCPEDPDAGLATIRLLVGAGYRRFAYYDNFGNYLTDIDSQDQGRFEDLDHYLHSNRLYGTAIYYFDICAFHGDDVDLADELRARSQTGRQLR